MLEERGVSSCIMVWEAKISTIYALMVDYTAIDLLSVINGHIHQLQLSYKSNWKKILGGRQALDWFSYLHRSLEVQKNLGSTSGEVGNRGSPQYFCKVGF